MMSRISALPRLRLPLEVPLEETPKERTSIVPFVHAALSRLRDGNPGTGPAPAPGRGYDERDPESLRREHRRGLSRAGFVRRKSTPGCRDIWQGSPSEEAGQRTRARRR